MEINIGTKIRELRQKHGRTQTELAEALGVSPQAVSRWEIGAAYPDLGLVPSIANYFGVSIDALFCFESERETKVNAIVSRARELAKKDNGVDINIEECLSLLRNALIEFPGEERIMYELAKTLSNAGWVRIGEHTRYDGAGYLIHDIETHRANKYWAEAMKLFETLLAESKDPNLTDDCAYQLTLLYCNLGEYEKGLRLAERMPSLPHSRELMRTYATDGAECSLYLGKALLKLAETFANVMVQTLMSKRSNFESDLPVKMLEGTIGLFETLFDDGNMGPYHSFLCQFLLYLSEHQWRCGMHDEAFLSLDKALDHAKAIESLTASDEKDPKYTSFFLAGVSMGKEDWGDIKVAQFLSSDWPFWMEPDYDDVYASITADPRWADWVKRTKES